MILKDAFARTGLKPPAPYVGSHILRHSLATQSGAARRLAGGDRRHAPPPLARLHHALCQARHRWAALDRPALAGCGRCEMSALSGELDRYLTIRRSLGYDLGTAERILRRFIAFAERRSAWITSAPTLFLRWQAAFGQANRKPGRRGLAWSGSSPNGCTALIRDTRCRRKALIPGRHRRTAALYLQRGRNPAHRRDRGRTALDQRHPRADLLDLVRSHRRYRPEGQRGDLSRRRRCRSGRRA